MSASAHRRIKARHSPPAAFFFILLLTAAVILAWGHYKLLDQDEVFVLQTDSVRTVRALVEVQRHVPISLDPLFYHLLEHAAIGLFGASAFAVRLPSLLGYLLMQVCLFYIARRALPGEIGERAGVVAAAVPALTATLYYGVEARPYGVLLGLCAASLLGWQAAKRDTDRRGALLLLGLSIALVLNTHYFAVLLLIPLCAAELFRIAQMRRIDVPMTAAILTGMGGGLFAVPFQHAAGEFRQHYYNAGRVGLHAVTQAYRALLLMYTDYSLRTQHLLMAMLLVCAAVFLWALLRSLRRPAVNLPLAEQVYLFTLAALPVFGFLLARFVTHSIEVRYVLPAIVALAVLIAVAALPLLRTECTYRLVFTLLLLSIVAAGAERLREELSKREERLASLTLPDAARAWLQTHPGAPIYLQNMGHFDEDGTYVGDPQLRARLALVYSRDQELRFQHHDTVSITAEHMAHFTPFLITRYEDLKREPGEHLLVQYHGGGWNWLDNALAQDSATETHLGPAMEGGEAVLVRFH